MTGAHRELFFNIDHFWVLYLLLPVVIGIVVYGIARRSRIWRLGRADFSFDNLSTRIVRVLRGGAGTERVLRDATRASCTCAS